MRALVVLCLFAVAAVALTPNNHTAARAAGGKTPNNHTAARADVSRFPSTVNKYNKDPSLCKSRVAGTTSRPAGQFQLLTNGILRLGVHGAGGLDAYPTEFPSLNTDSDNPVGLRYLAGGQENDATAPGCYCEGFGVSGVWTDSASVAGFTNQASGDSNIAYGTPTLINANAADAFGTISDGSAHAIGSVHQFRISNITGNVYEVLITLTNNHPTESITRLRYERTMDWDIYPTTFSECVDLDLGTAADIPCAHDNGFTAGNPDTDFPAGRLFNLGTACGGSAARSQYYSGPDDHGSAFLIQFADVTPATPLAPGASKTFKMFYGAAGNKAAARAALTAVGAEAFSLGYPNVGGSCDPSVNFGEPNTYLWGFAGVGGIVIPPNDDGSCRGTDCAHTHACPTAASASASTTTAKCATISFDGSC